MAAKQETERSSPEMNACNVIMKRLFSNTYKNIAWVFYEPLDPQLLGLHDYYEIVQEPMDLSTVRHRLNTGCYLNAVDFAKDIRLIFYNTYLYTNPDHLCYHMAQQLQIIFENMFAHVHLYICSGSKVRAEQEWSSSSSSSSDESDSSSSENEVSSPEVSSSIMGAPPICTPTPESPPPAPLGTSEQQEPFTAEEDLDLHAKIQQLDGEVLLHVIHFIQRMEGAEYCNKELELDICKLKVHTKRGILDYLASKGLTGKRAACTKPKYY
ncbi:bromodomain testis-specific protein [Drosophila mauritiana]|uniref:Bromodomain testis-specific protein n=1 Tax=Drosophila mauritiana TaxID=7226 RepID=A0A6P8JIH1_DROMA|nr:bromodomain testis-specific protein [Drosophila mauritiana]